MLLWLWRPPQIYIYVFIILSFNSLCTNKSHNKLFLNIENKTSNFIVSKQSVKRVFPFQAYSYEKKKKILHRVRKKSKRSLLKRRKKARQKEARARDGFTKHKEKEIRRKIMQWLEKAGLQQGLNGRRSGLVETDRAGCANPALVRKTLCTCKVKRNMLIRPFAQVETMSGHLQDWERLVKASSLTITFPIQVAPCLPLWVSSF